MKWITEPVPVKGSSFYILGFLVLCVVIYQGSHQRPLTTHEQQPTLTERR